MIGTTAASVSTLLTMVGRPKSPAALALDRLEQAGLLAADVRTRTAVQVAVHREGNLALEQPLLAEDAVLVRLLDRPLEHLRLMVVLAADEEERGVELTRPARDRDALEHQMRIEVDEQAVLEGARLGLVTVDREIPTATVGSRKERPLESRREARPAATAKHRGLDLVDDLARCPVQRLLQRLIATTGDVGVQIDGTTIGRVAPGGGRNALGQYGLGERHGEVLAGSGCG
jgi:hypothetical protein